jgi:alpha-1,6-mannosyltransferase
MLSRADFRSHKSIWLGFALLYVGIVGMGFCSSKIHFLPILAWILVSSLGFFLIFNILEKKSLFNIAIGLGLIIRLTLIFSFPNLSDDIYRFYWDGALTTNGYNPYGILPTTALGLTDAHDAQLYDLLNSPSYFTIYPPVSQVIFAVGSWTGSIVAFNIILKLCLVTIEFIGLWYMIRLLGHFKISKFRALLYYLCPLVMIEGVGNLHFEVVMASLLMISLYYFVAGNMLRSSLWMSLGIGTKLLPLMLLPYIWFRLSNKARFQFFGWLMVCCLIVFIPMMSSISSVGDSVDLYFRKFEFNGSIYSLLSWIGQSLLGYNLIHIIGPILGLITIVFNVCLAFKYHKTQVVDLFIYSLTVWTLYLLLATTVHPWYVIPLVAFSVFVDARYVWLWSSLIFLSYSYYDAGYISYVWILTLVEYSVVIWVWFNYRFQEVLKDQ